MKARCLLLEGRLDASTEGEGMVGKGGDGGGMVGQRGKGGKGDVEGDVEGEKRELRLRQLRAKRERLGYVVLRLEGEVRRGEGNGGRG